MLTRPDPIAGAGLLFAPMRRKRKWERGAIGALTTLTFASAALLNTGAARAADASAQDLLRKMTATYAVNTYQGTAQLTLKGVMEDKKPFTVTGTQEVAFRGPNNFFIKAWGAAVGGTQIRAFDGKENIYYDSMRNQYMKQPAPKGALSALSLFGIAIDAQSGKSVGTATISGHASYLVQAMLPLPAARPNADAQEKAAIEAFKKTMQPFELAIDKKNFRLLRVVQVSPDTKSTKMLEFTQQAFNPTLAENAFVFTPPPGAHLAEVGPPQQGGKPGAAGGPAKRALPPGVPNTSGRSGNPLPPPHASPGAGGSSAR